VAGTIDQLVSSGAIGGRTVQIDAEGRVECATYDVAPLAKGSVRIRTAVSAISPGTEMTFFGRTATNVYLHKTWDESLRLFVKGSPSLDYPVVFGYRAAGTVAESDADGIAPGVRIFGSWRHTEWTTLTADQAAAQRVPDGLELDDAVDIAQMGPICVNAVAHAEGEHTGAPVIVFGAGPIGLITAQVARATGAVDVHVVDRIASRLEIARSLGFHGIDGAHVDDVAVELKRDLGPEAIPVAFECTGSTLALHEAIRTVRRRGTVIAVGFYQGEARGLLLGEEFHHNGIDVRSAQIGNIHPHETMASLRQRTIELALDGRLRLGGLPRETTPVERVADAFEALKHPDRVLQVQLSYD
jgi:D-arabinose 1-dehydrogenase-like Zn-dependent alcohol dehydrogenase